MSLLLTVFFEAVAVSWLYGNYLPLFLLTYMDILKKKLLICIVEFFVPAPSLFINKRFALNEMFQRNASKFAIFYV